MSDAPRHALEGRGLVHSYDSGDGRTDDIRALCGVDVVLSAGEVLCLIGPNGSGKSTLVKVLAGLLAPDAGDVLVDGHRIADLDASARAGRIAVVPQILSTLHDVRVRSFVMGGRYSHLDFWRRSSSRDEHWVDLALEAADVADIGDRLFDELSGGQRQRVLIARALAQGAPVWLVDEPTTSLDPEHQVRVFRLIAELAREDRAALVVTHDLNLASQFATRIALLEGGRIVAVGSPDEVLRREVLEPVYGPHLAYGRLPGGPAGSDRPFVLPWIAPDPGPPLGREGDVGFPERGPLR